MSKEPKKEYSLDEIKGPFYPCPVAEQETVIQVSRDSQEAHVFTNDLTMLTRLKRAANSKGSAWKLTQIDYMRGLQCGWGFTCPKRLLSFRSKILSKGNENPEEQEEEPIEEETI